MNTRIYLAPLALSLLLCSCPGDEPEAAAAPGTETGTADTQAFDNTVEEVAGEIDAAAKAASDKITDENAEASLEDLSKSIEGGN
ncbi:MAG: hypothetical protein ACI8QC_001258 [Planctomycetota bacterium]|jgi:hypothetical protein